jgi:general secretion pathway protein C
MSRYLSWLANGTLLVLCCFLLANTANAVIAAWLAPSPDQLASTMRSAAASDRSWSQRQLILDRNLFGAVLQSKLPPPPSEAFEVTTLPLTLIGTAAASDSTQSWAAVQDRDTGTHLVLRQGDSVKDKATVERIEPKRIVLRENGELRELALSDDPPVVSRAKTQRNRTAARRTARSTSRRAARAKPPAAPSPPIEDPLAGAAQLFSQANLVPKFENGEMVGVQIGNIQPGSTFEAAGIQSGEVITELNGIRIDSQEQSQRALAEMANGDSLNLTIRDSDGNERAQELPLTPTF